MTPQHGAGPHYQQLRKKVSARQRRKFVKTIRRLGRKRGRSIRIHWR